jgi:hypothetical protein
MRWLLLSVFLVGCNPDLLIDDTRQQKYLKEHRKRAPLAEYDINLEHKARLWADMMADRCDGILYPSIGLQNVYVSWGVRKPEIRDIVEQWDIDKGITKVGCGEVMCADDLSHAVSWYYVCNYKKE